MRGDQVKHPRSKRVVRIAKTRLESVHVKVTPVPVPAPPPTPTAASPRSAKTPAARKYVGGPDNDDVTGSSERRTREVQSVTDAVGDHWSCLRARRISRVGRSCRRRRPPRGTERRRRALPGRRGARRTTGAARRDERGRRPRGESRGRRGRHRGVWRRRIPWRARARDRGRRPG